jgi:hypothetical protein
MKHYLTGLLFLSLITASCGSSKKDEAGTLNDKKVKLQELKTEQTSLTEKIVSLEKEIAGLDTNVVAKPKLVAVTAIDPQNFEHFIELQGKVDATNIAYVAPPNGQGGVVKALYVRQGTGRSQRTGAGPLRRSVDPPANCAFTSAADHCRRHLQAYEKPV